MSMLEAGETHEENQGTIAKWVHDYASFIARRPHTCCLSCGFTIFVLGVISGAAGMMNIDRQDKAWLVFDGDRTRAYMAWEDAETRATSDRRLTGQDNTSAWESTVSDRRLTGVRERWSVSILYKTDKDASGTMFTSARLQEMCRLEKKIADIEDVVGIDWSQSAAFHFYGGSYPPSSCNEVSQSTIDSKVNDISTSIQQDGPQSIYAGFVTPEFQTTGKSAYTRATLWIGIPDNYDGGEEEHREMVLIDNVLKDLGQSYGFLSSALQAEDDRFLESGPLRVRLSFEADEMGKMIYGDFGLSFGAMVIVFFLMWWHLKSSFLASVGMFQIVFSLPVGALLYKGLFQIRYFEFLHILVVYLVLGIGADDIFVLVDTFRHMCELAPTKADGRYKYEDLVKPLSSTLYRTGSAVFNTSFTTTVAFLACSISRVMPMRTCGWFAAICIVLNYIFTLTLTPAAMVLWHLRFQQKRCCCPSPSLRPESEPLENPADAPPKKRPIIERFLHAYYMPMMSMKVAGVRIVALIIAVVMIIVGIQGTVFAMQLTPPTKPEVWVPDNHMSKDINTFVSKTFFTSDYDKKAIIYFTWGISDLDTDGMDVYKPDDFSGNALFDSSFDLTTEEAQNEILATCQAMQELECRLEGCSSYGGKLMLQDAQKSYSCFLEDMKNYLGTLPTGQAFITALQDWQDNGAEHANSSEVLQPDPYHDIGFIDGELKFVVVRLRSTMSEDVPYSTGTEVRDLIEDFVNNRKDGAPSSLKSMNFHSDGMIFSNFDLSTELIGGLFSGIAIAFPLAFLVLLASSGNIIVSTYAVLCVGAIVLSVLGFCKSAMGWDLGVGEAVAGVIVIGYSVDYVVHFAHIYCEAGHVGKHTRDERCRYAVENMGSTIFAGALTTTGSGIIMFFCFFTFFFKMAVLICVTIMYAFLFSMGLLVSLLWLIGPEGTFGDVCCFCNKSKMKVAPAETASGAAEKGEANEKYEVTEQKHGSHDDDNGTPEVRA